MRDFTLKFYDEMLDGKEIDKSFFIARNEMHN